MKLLIKSLRILQSFNKRQSLTLYSSSSSSSISNSNNNNKWDSIKIYDNKSVLVVGDGDMSFSLSICKYGNCKEVIATTWDDSKRLFNSFVNARNNVDSILQNNGIVHYEIDATKLSDYYNNNKFDIVVWNFPHVPGKANIKRNRILLYNFFKSAKNVINDDGMIITSLVGGQSGTAATSTDDWNKSFKLVQNAAEAGVYLVNNKPFNSSDYIGYQHKGHRGHGGSFLIDNAEIFCLQKKLKNPALQAPLYIHEVHVLANGIALDVNIFQAKARYLVKKLCNEIDKNHALWTVNLVDIYVCPRTSKISHVFQISYCSLTKPLSRQEADDIREYVETKLPKELSLEPRIEKHGHSVSQSYGWYIASALHQLQSLDNESNRHVDESTIIKFDKDDGISKALRDIESNNEVDDSLKELNFIQATARSLWWKRAGYYHKHSYYYQILIIIKLLLLLLLLLLGY